EPDHVSAISTQMLKSKIDKKPIKQLIKQSITKSSILNLGKGA
ncbi:high-affinity nickel-transporter protein, partial [Marine Group I thaumarchaeote SCGC AAA799-N04]